MKVCSPPNSDVMSESLINSQNITGGVYTAPTMRRHVVVYAETEASRRISRSRLDADWSVKGVWVLRHGLCLLSSSNQHLSSFMLLSRVTFNCSARSVVKRWVRPRSVQMSDLNVHPIWHGLRGLGPLAAMAAGQSLVYIQWVLQLGLFCRRKAPFTQTVTEYDVRFLWKDFC